MICVATNRADSLQAPRRGKARISIFHQQISESEDRGHRRADLVTDVGDEIVASLVGGLGREQRFGESAIGAIERDGALLARLARIRPARRLIGRRGEAGVTASSAPALGGEELVALGDQIGGIASKLGLSTTDVASHLSNLLPQVVDKLTPDGQIPEGGALDQGLDSL